MTPEDLFREPEHPHSGPRPRQDLDVLPQGSYFEPAEPAGYPYEETYSTFGGARYLEQHWAPASQFGADASPAPGHYAPTGQAPHEDPPTIELGPPIDTQPVEVHFPYPQPEPGEGPGPLFVIGDVHGYLDELLAALHQQGLIDTEGHWSAGRSRVWFLGDFTDRGPDGIGVIDLVMQLAAEAAAAGGYCRALMGNHELLFLGASRYGDEAVQSTAGTASFLAAWRLNGGQQHDLERLQPHHISWLSRLPAMALEDGHLLLHSDTTAYLEYGETIADVNDAMHTLLADEGIDEWWDAFRKFTKRFAFRGQAGTMAAQELLAVYGGYRVVHGHSPIPYLTGDQPEDGTPPHVPGPYIYADELAIAMDGGVTMDGRLLVARLPLN
ncbi:calcineurin-like phosphoesterase family protein [Kitasatospora sp. SolWspMP-SS2h]|uniref:metallophosphoesterase n=1 Tax=Kitasatospora sp. SolWspMP-SS2h TaxID=1305729 RepID=UPI000DB994AA|nr:metallophosphoesterase [Kitasatospora sp. SolWspMP-SS2h]RAJ37545.1 calcineurin-like phosphoesterase family protein [Kitasatospora sp. SolWspMP-SS2h]